MREILRNFIAGRIIILNNGQSLFDLVEILMKNKSESLTPEFENKLKKLMQEDKAFDSDFIRRETSIFRLGKRCPKIRRNSTREVICAVTIVKVYRRPYPHHGNTSSCSRTLIVWKQSLGTRSTDLGTLRMAHSRGFEPLTSAFGVYRFKK